MERMIELIRSRIAKLPEGDPGRATLADLATELVLSDYPPPMRMDVKVIKGSIFVLVYGGCLTESTVERLMNAKDHLGKVVILEAEESGRPREI